MWQILVRAVPPVCVTLDSWSFYHGAWLCFRTIFRTGKTASWTSLTVLGFRHLSLLLTLSYSFCLYDMCPSQSVSLHALVIGKQRVAVPSLDISPLPPSLANTLLTCPVFLFAHECLLWTEVDYVANYAIKVRFWTLGQLFKTILMNLSTNLKFLKQVGLITVNSASWMCMALLTASFLAAHFNFPYSSFPRLGIQGFWPGPLELKVTLHL